MTDIKKQKPNVQVRLSDDLERYLRERAAASHRTITAEIRMRLELSHEADLRQASKDRS